MTVATSGRPRVLVGANLPVSTGSPRRPGGRAAGARECPAGGRGWLAADPPAGRLFSSRTQAALTVAALTLSATTPAIGVAAGPHHGDGGGASPKHEGPGDPGLNPGFDPGGPVVDP